MNRNVLIVDDDPKVVDSLRRRLRDWFNVSTALSAEQGLKALEKEGPFAVVVSDQRMHKVNGIQFLAEVRKTAPETVRLMLTSCDKEVAVAAINEAGVFRFITKSSRIKDLIDAIEDGIIQYRNDTRTIVCNS